MSDRAERLRARFREIWEAEVPFNQAAGIRVTRWDADGIVLQLDGADWLRNGVGTFHGGVIAALADTAGNGAVVAGHDFVEGKLPSTVSMSINYLSPGNGEQLIAEAHCTKRGRRVQHATVAIRDGAGNRVAEALLAVVLS